MPIPTTRAELLDGLQASYAKLRAELEDAGPGIAERPCVDGWTVRELLAVRAWWTESVARWVREGRRGRVPVTPAPGYRWRETPRLNAEIVRRARSQSYGTIVGRLARGYGRVLATIDELEDRELLGVGAFPWAGRYPVSRWISINTTRQYTTARAFIRRALRRG